MEHVHYVRMKTLGTDEVGLRAFSFGSERFTAERGWLPVSPETAAYLAGVRTRDEIDAPCAFDLWAPPPPADASPLATATAVLQGSPADRNRLGADTLPPDARASANPAFAEVAQEAQEVQAVHEAREAPSAAQGGETAARSELPSIASATDGSRSDDAVGPHAPSDEATKRAGRARGRGG